MDAGEAADLRIVLIAGVDGLIGHVVARQLAAAGRSVLALDQVPVQHPPCPVVRQPYGPVMRRSSRSLSFAGRRHTPGRSRPSAIRSGLVDRPRASGLRLFQPQAITP
ncbi:hypothetical protein ACFQU2_20530 [Siccirubricoccus deserti]